MSDRYCSHTVTIVYQPSPGPKTLTIRVTGRPDGMVEQARLALQAESPGAVLLGVAARDDRNELVVAETFNHGN